MTYLQNGVANGNSTAVSSLAEASSVEDHVDPVWGVDQVQDPERARRYKQALGFLFRYDYLHASVSENDRIVPLHPAPLPAWDDASEWLKAHEANTPPTFPSEERFAEVARAKGLDLQMGRTLIAGC